MHAVRCRSVDYRLLLERSARCSGRGARAVRRTRRRSAGMRGSDNGARLMPWRTDDAYRARLDGSRRVDGMALPPRRRRLLGPSDMLTNVRPPAPAGAGDGRPHAPQGPSSPGRLPMKGMEGRRPCRISYCDCTAAVGADRGSCPTPHRDRVDRRRDRKARRSRRIMRSSPTVDDGGGSWPRPRIALLPRTRTSGSIVYPSRIDIS